MNNGVSILLKVGMIGALAIAGAGIMYGLNFLFALEGDNMPSQIVYTFMLIALGLTIPYFILKLLFSAAHDQNENEKEIHLSDIPRDQQQLDQKLRRQ